MADFVNPWSSGMFAMPGQYNAGPQMANTSPLPQPFVPPTNGAYGGGYGPPSPSYPGGTLNGRPINGNGTWGFGQYPTGWNPTTGRFDPVNGYQPPSFGAPYGTLNGHPLGSGPSAMTPARYPNGYDPATNSFGGAAQTQLGSGSATRYAQDPNDPNVVRMADGNQGNALQFGRQPILTSQKGGQAQQAPATQTLEQFIATLGNPGAYSSGQIGDMYAKSLQQQAQRAPSASLTAASQPAPPTNFWQNVGPGGTANPFPGMGGQPFNSAWGQQRFGFDPRSLSGQNVTGDLSWYYGRDAIGRPINRQGDASPTFSAPADGFQRRRWYMG